MLRRLSWFVSLFLLCPAVWSQAGSCAGLAKVTLPHATIMLAQEVPAGAFHLSRADGAGAQQENPFPALPSFCRVVMKLTPSADSDITVELWLPEHGWNRKFLGVGNGGFAGEIDFDSLAAAISQGYAAAATDTGHQGSFNDAQWALGHPQKVIDFGYRAIHEMTVEGKTVLRNYYAAAPAYSYFESCSNGGRQALMEAQRFPADYNGILAGAPANNWTHLLTSAVYNSRILNLDPASYIPQSKLPAIDAAVLAACGAESGTQDGFVNDPPLCRFDPSVLLCRGEDTDKCLTGPQVAAMHAIYAGTHDAAGVLVFPGYSPGGELGDNGWGPWIFGPSPRESLMYQFGTRYFADMVYVDPRWNYANFTVGQGLADAVRKTGGILDADDPNLRPFARRGGKLILYHGWSDAAIPPMSTVEYYESVRSTVGAAEEDSFLRLFMVPGMQHCGLGPGPNSFGQNGRASASGADDAQHDIRLALEAWVEKGTPPETIIAAKYEGSEAARSIVLSRPLCAWPLIARYRGAGDPRDAESFACVTAGH